MRILVRRDDGGGPVPELTVDESVWFGFRLRMMLAHTYDMGYQAVCDGDALPVLLVCWCGYSGLIRIFMAYFTVEADGFWAGYDASMMRHLTFHPFLRLTHWAVFLTALHPHMLCFPARHGMEERDTTTVESSEVFGRRYHDFAVTHTMSPTCARTTYSLRRYFLLLWVSHGVALCCRLCDACERAWAPFFTAFCTSFREFVPFFRA